MLTNKNISSISSIETPFYYYDIDLLRATLSAAKRESQKYGFHIHYAIKANFDARILEEVKAAGFGIDCVSGGEVRAAIDGGFDPSQIVYAGVAKSDKEIIYSLENDIFAFNSESLEELCIINEIAASMGKCASVAMRINPDVDPATHKYISTGGKDNKFGISYTELDRVIELIPQLSNVSIDGIHFHIGSQITDLSSFTQLAARVNDIASWFESKGVLLKFINVGGGLGISYDKPTQNPIPDFESYFAIFAKGITLRPGQSLHFELGRSLVCQCGELVTKVLFGKQAQSGKNYIFVDAGMSELMRPALYNAYHEIVNISKEGSQCNDMYSIAGPICESSDIFAEGLVMPKTERGDLLVIRSCGAYGRSMASNYNLREFAPSVYSDQL